MPGHNHLNNIAQAVKDGIRLAGGVPVVFPAIAVCDGIAMGHVGMKYSLASRELIADSVEAMATAHRFDGLVFMVRTATRTCPACSWPPRRLNMPAIVISGGADARAAACAGGNGDLS